MCSRHENALARFHCRARGATLCVSHSRRTCRNATSLDECTIPCVDAEGVRGIYKISTTYHIVMYVDHMSSQARYGSCTMTCTMTCSRWVCRPEVRGRQAVCIIYMDHMSWQARYASCTMIWSIWARISADMQVRQAICVMYMAGPIHILYHDMHRELVDTHLHSRADVCLCFM
jgi:hypothetical protein